MVKYYLLPVFLLIFSIGLYGQTDPEKAGPILQGVAKPIQTAPLSSKDLIPATTSPKEVNPKMRTSNKVVPGKGYPKTMDAAWQQKMGEIPGKALELSFDVTNVSRVPTDPTGAVGPNHYVNAWNAGFAVHDKQGNLLLPHTDLESLGGEFVGERRGDPIVIYDQFADRFLITQFAGCPYEPGRGCPSKIDPTNALLVAISKGPDPVNDGWYTYRFPTGTFPDYPKFFVWSDGYYVTTNQDPEDDAVEEVVFVLERDKMLQGAEARHLGFPLPGIRINGFYSPAALNAVGDQMPPPGNMPIIYFQDDAWAGVNVDHLKIWLLNVDWNNPQNSVITESQELDPSQGVTPFHSTFDGGSVMNLSQVGSAPDVDALQGAVMWPTSYRRFETHNSVVFNFVVDVDPSQVEHAGIRWYELRQAPAGGPWSVYQEGTYAPDTDHRWCGSIGIDKHGNIGLGFTVMNDNFEDLLLPTLRYTGRYANDPLGIMTFEEETIVESTVPDNSSRYGDYSHTSIDPVDNETFWFNGEYFRPGSRLNRVGVFKIAPKFARDVGVAAIVSPKSSTLGEEEEITVAVRNFGSESQSNFEVWYQVGNGPRVTEVFTGSIPSTAQVEFTFSETVDLSQEGETYEISAATDLEGDLEPSNDLHSVEVTNLPPRDIGVTEILHPMSSTSLGQENIVVALENFGGEPQSGFEVGYMLNQEEWVREVFSGTLEVDEIEGFTFSRTTDFSTQQGYEITAATFLEDDSNPENDETETFIAHLDCIPEGSSCAFNDGINSFYLEEIVNENIYCTNGYLNFIGLSTRLDRQLESHRVGVQAPTSNEFSMWIDFNDNAVFEDSERLVSSGTFSSSSVTTAFEFEIPEDAPLGEHLLRARAGDVSYAGDLNDPCDVMEYGTTNDYTVIIVDGVEESELQQGELIVTSSEEDIYEITFETAFQSPLWLTVHDMLGQKLVENLIRKNFNSYSYTLDMSHVATGVYLVRIGTRDEGRVARIIVH